MFPNKKDTSQIRQTSLDIAKCVAEMLIDLVESRELGYLSCKQNHNATRYPYEQLFSPAREYTFSSKQYQKAKANASHQVVSPFAFAMPYVS